ncbi:hypothetical protein AB0M02_09705 [Actinoplanes sp. NPDC051861]|uniref:hypothetical protein n=1 Tax=Actinoplanes sp. NPDC051861 TaxID=3155170 RepID=UPI003437DB38
MLTVTLNAAESNTSGGLVAILLMAVVLTALAIRLLSTALGPFREVIRAATAAVGSILLVFLILIMLIASVAMSARN